MSGENLFVRYKNAQTTDSNIYQDKFIKAVR